MITESDASITEIEDTVLGLVLKGASPSKKRTGRKVNRRGFNSISLSTGRAVEDAIPDELSILLQIRVLRPYWLFVHSCHSSHNMLSRQGRAALEPVG